METPLVNQAFLLQKIEGKGGWTYTEIPQIPPNKHSHFGWVRVRGSIDTYEFKSYNLMPLGNGKLFLPVRAEIRKIIKKQAGDWVHVTLYEDTLPLDIPEELKECLEQEPLAYQKFMALSEGKQKEHINWIYSAKTDDTKTKRILELMTKV